MALNQKGKMSTKIFSRVPDTFASRNVNNLLWNILGGIFSAFGMIVITRYQVKFFAVDQLFILSLWLTGQALLGVADAGMSATAVRVYTAVNDVVDSPEKRLKQCLFTFEKVYAVLSIVVMLCAVTLMLVRIGGLFK